MDGHERLQFVSLGMFIIDEIEYMDGKSPAQSIIGGAGTYAAVGARLAAGKANGHSVGWIIDVGSDFPPHFRVLIDSWQTSCLYRVDKTRLTTRAWNGYGADEYRSFRYLTSKVRLDEDSLSDAQVLANAYHLVCSSQRCIDLVQGILARRKRLAGNASHSDRPCFVWEPVPDLCIPGQLPTFQEAVRHVDVVSPNSEELAAFFHSNESAQAQSQQELAQCIVDWSIGPDGKGSLVVREGSHGCSAYSQAIRCHLPAYFPSSQSSMVADPTGGGNCFLGALAYSKVRSSTLVMSDEPDPLRLLLDGTPEDLVTTIRPLIYATVAASYAIQQTGMPALSFDEASAELWNGESFADRVSAYVRREEQLIKGILRER